MCRSGGSAGWFAFWHLCYFDDGDLCLLNLNRYIWQDRVLFFEDDEPALFAEQNNEEDDDDEVLDVTD